MLNFKTVTTTAFILAILLAVLYVFFPFSKIVFLGLFATWLTLTTIGSFHILWNYFLTAHHSNPFVKTKSVAITFDDGPHPKFTPKVLELLKKYNAKATFFCIGKQVEKHPEIAKQIINEGHTIANHSFHHANNFGFFNTQKVILELHKTNEIIQKIIGKKTVLFRPPFGVTNPNIANAVQETKHKVIGWNVRSLDTVIKNEEKILNRITKKLQKGDIILLHDTSNKTVNVLERLLLFLTSENYTAITVNELLNIQPYE